MGWMGKMFVGLLFLTVILGWDFIKEYIKSGLDG